MFSFYNIILHCCPLFSGKTQESVAPQVWEEHTDDALKQMVTATVKSTQGDLTWLLFSGLKLLLLPLNEAHLHVKPQINVLCVNKDRLLFRFGGFVQ